MPYAYASPFSVWHFVIIVASVALLYARPFDRSR